jgi:probable HAF family extracellular repeat protein
MKSPATPIVLLVAALAIGYIRSGESHRSSTSAPHFVGLGDLPGGSHFSSAISLSSDGATVFGYSSSAMGMEEFRWSRDEGLIGLDIPHLDETPDVVAYAEQIDAVPEDAQVHDASNDGKVVVGTLRRGTGHDEASRWTDATGPIGLGVLPGHTTSAAYGVSADGSVIVGTSGNYIHSEAFYWSEETGMVGLGSLRRGSGDGAAFDVSADGSVIVGFGTGANGWEAFIWNRAHGMRSLRESLERDYQLGTSLRGWKLRTAVAISDDSTTVAGSGLNPAGKHEAWIACLAKPRPATTRGSTIALGARSNTVALFGQR